MTFNRMALPISKPGLLLYRSILLLLVLRVIAAPIALRPAATGDPSRVGLVVRICSWPADPGRAFSSKLTVGETTPAPAVDMPPAGIVHVAGRAARRMLQLPPLDRYARRAGAYLRC